MNNQSNIIHTNRFDADRNRRARHLREYGEHLDELNGYPPVPVSREAPVAGDIRAIMLGLACGIVAVAGVAGVKFRVWEWVLGL